MEPTPIRIKGLPLDRQTCRNCHRQNVKCFLAFFHMETPEGTANARVCELLCSDRCCEEFRNSQIGMGPSCPSCGAPHSPIRCEVCRCAYYCNLECQTRHCDAHASICNIVQPVLERSLTEEITMEIITDLLNNTRGVQLVFKLCKF